MKDKWNLCLMLCHSVSPWNFNCKNSVGPDLISISIESHETDAGVLWQALSSSLQFLPPLETGAERLQPFMRVYYIKMEKIVTKPTHKPLWKALLGHQSTKPCSTFYNKQIFCSLAGCNIYFRLFWECWMVVLFHSVIYKYKFLRILRVP